MVTWHALALLLAANPGPSDFAQAHAELERCAERIEELKARQELGRELDRLLRRAQELAAQLERSAEQDPSLGAAAPLGPTPEELRERADAARDEADRLAAEIAALDVRIQDARRIRGDPDAAVGTAALGEVPGRGNDRLRALLAERVALARRRAAAEAEAAQLEADALAAEGDEGKTRGHARARTP
jgi:DNA repair exonuclease SbcCD ATPase subunit